MVSFLALIEVKILFLLPKQFKKDLPAGKQVETKSRKMDYS
jgi:hypothetical protein